MLQQPGYVSRFVPLAVFVASLWMVESVDLITGSGTLDVHGILPRSVGGLDGILWAPWLHGGFGHLVSNTLPLVVLGALVAAHGARRWFFVTGFVLVGGGLLTWLLARRSIHIGASIVVFGYITYLVAVGFHERKLTRIVIGLVVLAVYGGPLLAGILPVNSGISWEGHLFGALAGLGAARVAASGFSADSAN